MRRIWLAALVGVLIAAASPAAARYDTLPEYDGPAFQALYDHAVANTLPGLAYPDQRPEVTGNPELDERIWMRALERGYRLRPLATGELASVGGVRMQPPAAVAWEALRAEVRAAGLGFGVSSAYRSAATQRSTFLTRLRGTSDSAIDSALTWYSVPGASKHHSGYALDFRYPNGTFGEFRRTPGHAWLAADNFARPKRHGLIPSYPDDVEDQGPNPEPWEYVWVGVELVRCGVPQDMPAIAGPAAAVMRDLGRCPGGQNPVEIPAWLR
jgi:hypothetical protein